MQDFQATTNQKPRLRDYQLEAVDDVFKSFDQGYNKPLLVAPTGAGKTIMSAAICDRAIEIGWRILFLVHLDVLPDQTAEKFDLFNLPYGFIKAGLGEDRDAQIQIASIQTLPRRQWWKSHKFDLIILDECHKTAWSKCVEKLMSHHAPDARYLGLTGSPWRLSKREGMGDRFDRLVAAPLPSELMDMGFLVHGKYYSLPKADLDGVGTVAGDYNEADLAVACNRPDLHEKIVSEYFRLLDGKTAIGFCVNVSHAESLASAFNTAGVSADVVTGETPKWKRKILYSRLESGDLKVLTSCNVLSEGFDVPSVEGVILARPTKSRALYFQQLGRGLRPFEGKTHCVVLDQAGNAIQHGFAEDLTIEDFELTHGKPTKGGSAPKKECPECKVLMNKFAVACPECGFKFLRAKIFQTGHLEELIVSPKKQPKAKPKKVEDPIAPLKDEIDLLCDVINQRGNKISSLWFRVTEKYGDKASHADWLYVARLTKSDPRSAYYWHQKALETARAKQSAIECAPMKHRIDAIKSEIERSGKKISSLQFRIAQELGSLTSLEDWLYVAEICGYTQGWAKYRFQETRDCAACV